jgi:hypothetical protein
LGIFIPEIVQQVGVGTTGAAMAVKGGERKTYLNKVNNVPLYFKT